MNKSQKIKNLSFFSLALFLILIVASCCKGDDTVPTDISSDDYRLWSSGTCNRYYKSGDSLKVFKPIWAADYVYTYKVSDTTCNININTYYLSGVVYESLHFKFIPLRLQQNLIKESSNPFHLVPSTYYSIYKDVKGFEASIGGHFTLDSLRKDNRIALTKIDKANNLVEGTFNLTFYSELKKDTLFFRNGTFSAPYPK